MLDKIIKVWEKCNGDKLKQGLLVFLGLLIVSIIAVAIHLYWEVILLAVAGILYLLYREHERRKQIEFQQQQRLYIRQKSVEYTMRHGLAGSEKHFNIPDTPNKGYYSAVHRIYEESGAFYYVLLYTRLPNSPDLTAAECEPLRKILNS